MRKVFFLLIITLLFSCKREQENSKILNYEMKLKIKGAKENSTAYLKKQEDGISIKLDSAIIKNEQVEFNGNVNLPQVYGVFIGNNQGIFPIIEKGTIIINADIERLYDAEITGTKLNDQLREYKNKARKISEKMNTSFHEFQKARAENNFEKINEINKKLKSINRELIDYKVRFITNNPDSFVSSMILFSLIQNKEINLKKTKYLYDNLSSDVKKSEFSKKVSITLETSNNK